MNTPKLVLLIFFVLFALENAHSQSAFWTTGSTLGFTPRYALCSAVVNDKIYVIGGENSTGGFCNTLEVYDPTSDTWISPQTTGYFSPHFAATASVVDGKIYVFGGGAGLLTFNDSVSVFDPSTNIWSTIDPGEGQTFTERWGLTSAAIGSNIYVIGGAIGYAAPYEIANFMEIFDTKTNRWSSPELTVDSLLPVWEPVACVINDKIFVIGRQDDTACHCEVQVYDPMQNKWSVPRTNGMKIKRGYFSANEINGKIYVVGGGNFNPGGGGLPVETTEVYDPSLRIWDTLSVTGTFTKRQYHTASAIDDKIYVLGGDNGSFLNTNEILHLSGSGVAHTQSQKENVYIYPNPASTTLNIVSTDPSPSFKIIDILGRTVVSGRTLDHGTLTLDISSLPRGVYSVLVQRSDLKDAFVLAGKFSSIDR